MSDFKVRDRIFVAAIRECLDKNYAVQATTYIQPRHIGMVQLKHENAHTLDFASKSDCTLMMDFFFSIMEAPDEHVDLVDEMAYARIEIF